MKGFLIFLLFAGLCAAGIYYYDEIRAYADRQWGIGRTEIPELPEYDATPSGADRPPEPGSGSEPMPEPAPEQPAGEAVADAPPDPEPEGEPGTDPEPALTNDAYAEQFPLPEFEPIEEVVDNWTAIPETAFPQRVHIRRDVTMTLPGGIGRSVAKAGSTVAAMGIRGTTLIVAPHSDAIPRGSIPLDETDLKQVLTEVYEAYKTGRTQAVLAQRDRARREDMREEMEARAAEFAKSAGERPKVAANGTVPLMAASIQNDDVTEFDLADIDRWGPVLVDTIEGVEYWTGTVQYKARTIFGVFPAEVMALMRHGKVEKWIYAGSHEPVP